MTDLKLEMVEEPQAEKGEEKGKVDSRKGSLLATFNIKVWENAECEVSIEKGAEPLRGMHVMRAQKDLARAYRRWQARNTKR